MITHPRSRPPIWKGYAVLLPNGEPLLCKHGKVVYATEDAASEAARAMERELSWRMRFYLCTERPPHYHLATGCSGASRRKHKRERALREGGGDERDPQCR